MFGIGIPELLIIVLILLVIVAGVFFLFRTLLKPQQSFSLGNQSERLKELQKMKKDGLITEDEFNEKRNEILGSL